MAFMQKKVVDLKLDLGKVTIAEAQALLKPHLDKTGAVCPLCRQLVKLYSREITSSMAYVLILLHRHFQSDKNWLHVPSFLTNVSTVGAAVRGGDWAKLRYWDLIEEKPKTERKDGSKRAGFYRMTEKGHQFVRGETKVPRAVLLYADKFLGFDEGEVSIQECLGKEFDYADLMAGRLGGFSV